MATKRAAKPAAVTATRTAKPKSAPKPKAKVAAKPATTRRKTAARPKASHGLGFSIVTPALTRLARQMTAALAELVAPTDALSLLQQDHRTVKELFEAYEKADRNAEKGRIAGQICLELRVHAKLEEELVYPPAHEKIEEDVVDEAMVEHAAAKNLIEQIEGMKPGEHLYDAKVKVLSEYIKHHVVEEENEMFPQLRSSGIDLEALGEKLRARKQQLLEQLSAKR